MKACFLLFREMFAISLFVLGGGYAILAVADERFSRKRKWTEEGEIIGQLPLFQSMPGIIAGCTAVYVGRKVAGLRGAACALAGVALPSIAVFSAVSAGYAAIPVEEPHLAAAFTGMRCALSGVIAAMLAKTWKKCVPDLRSFAVFAAALAAIGPLRIPPAAAIAAAGAAGAALAWKKRAKARLLSIPWAFPLLFLKYGSIAFGGGYVLVPAYVRDFVGAAAPYLQLAESEFADVMALTQATPGPISVNCATFFGYRMGLEASGGSIVAGVALATAATLCLLLPGAVLLCAALGSLERFKASRTVQGLLAGVRPVAAAMMLNALWTFLSMCAWSPAADGAPGVAVHPLPAFAVAACAFISHRRLLGAVPLMLTAALLLALAA